jgi:hypothetical protein
VVYGFDHAEQFVGRAVEGLDGNDIDTIEDRCKR